MLTLELCSHFDAHDTPSPGVRQLLRDSGSRAVLPSQGRGSTREAWRVVAHTFDPRIQGAEQVDLCELKAKQSHIERPCPTKPKPNETKPQLRQTVCNQNKTKLNGVIPIDS